MKVTGIETIALRLPLARPIRTAIHHVESLSVMIVLMRTDEGALGESYLWVMNPAQLGLVRAAVESLEPVVVGSAVAERVGTWQRMWDAINFVGHKGVTVFGISAIDTGLWDLAGKAAGLSVSRLLGRVRDAVPAYASGGLWHGLDTGELVEEAQRFVDQGFRAMKIRIGKPDWREDVARVEAVRAAVGDGITLMVDANQGLDVKRAIRLGHALEDCALAWFEEPVPAWDLAGSGEVARALITPLASGETEYARYGFRDMLAAGAADIWMPDLERVGGISEFMTVAHLAAAHDIPISPHIFTEQSLQLCGAIANCPWSEHMPWFERLFTETMVLRDGALEIPDRPGLGFTFDMETIAALRLDA